MKLTEANVGQLFTDGNTPFKFTGVKSRPLFVLKNLETGEEKEYIEESLPALKRLIPEPRKYERKQVTPTKETPSEPQNNGVKTDVKETPKRTRRADPDKPIFEIPPELQKK